MGKRKLFLLFLSAMSVSIIMMVIIYGLFIKDLDFDLNVKNPESAPSPIDVFHKDEADAVEEEDSMATADQGPAQVTTPEQAQAAQDKNQAEGQSATAPEPQKITEVVPLAPQVGPIEDQPPLAPLVQQGGEPPMVSKKIGDDPTPSLHYVYLDGFSSKESAEQAIQHLQDRNLTVTPYIRQHRGQIILQFGVFSDRENAEVLAQKLRTQNVYVKVD